MAKTEVAVAATHIPTPMEMIERAISSGATVETLTSLMTLQERWEANQAKHAFDEAISAAKAKIPAIVKNKKVDYTSPGKPRVAYRYENFAEIARVIDPILQAHGLSYRFRTESSPTAVTVTCVIAHVLGHFEENSLTGPADTSGGKNSIQSIGSTVMYLQRYTLKAALGLAVTEDDDGKGATDGGYISMEEATALRVRLTALGGGTGDGAEEQEIALCNYLGVDSLETTPKNLLKRAQGAVSQKEKALAKKAEEPVGG